LGYGKLEPCPGDIEKDQKMFDQTIITKFKLFSGIRNEEEDNNILKKLQNAVENETANFLVENRKWRLEEIPFWKTRLESRINYFLTTILVKAKGIHVKRITT
jgi:hypothetical protein